MIDLLLIEDHPLFREGLDSALARLAPRWRLIGVSGVAAGLEVLRERGDAIGLILIDWMLPDGDGLSGLRVIGAAMPHIPRVLISGRGDRDIVDRARRAGASGFIPKSLDVREMLAVIEILLDGGTWFPAEVPATAGAPPAARADGDDVAMSPRQLAVLRLLCQGCNNKQIARELDIADRTVRANLTELFRLLGVASRTQLVIEAQKRGLDRA